MANKVLLLKQSVYGLRQSTLNFYRHLQQGLESRGFIKSDHDDYLFISGIVISLFWVDDYVFYSKESNAIEKLILNLKDEFLLKRESDMAKCLGLKIDRTKEGQVVLSQTGLIERILSVMNMTECNHNYTPSDKITPGKDVDGDLCME